MIESVVTISITGLIAGFIFAMPIAGPVSILIVSNALNGKLLYSNRVSLGAALSDFIYIFIAVFGITKLYSWYKPAIPYLFIIGAVFFIILGIKIVRSPLDSGKLEDTSHITSINTEGKGGFYTGFMVNLLNPTLFISGLISSFFVISLVSALGFNTGGLEMRINDQVNEISSIEGTDIRQKINVERLNRFSENRQQDNSTAGNKKKTNDEDSTPRNHLIMSFCYALFLAAGGLIWFYFLAYMLSRYRKLINLKILSSLIKIFGVSLCLLGLYFGYMGAVHFIRS